ncbi:MAG: succinate dehydrogenase assembly factor 2 [Pseudomonadales bacterium]
MTEIIQSPADGSPARKRAYWRSRRGMTELEQMLLPFVLQRFDQLSSTQQETYARLLDCEDWDIYDWLQGRSTAPDHGLAEMVAMIAPDMAAARHD